MFALLLRDTDSRLMLTELDPVQVSIIFRLCSQSASFIKQEYLLDNESDTKKDSLETDWRNLQDALEDSLIPLITRYRSEDDHLEIVLDLLECCDITLIEGKALQSLVKTCTELFETLQSETSLSKMGKVIRFWMSSQSKRKVVVSSLKPLLEHSWKKILETVHRLPSSNEESNAKKGRGARRSQVLVL